MGGTGGEVRGKTQAECWDKFRPIIKEATGLGLHREYPANKKEAYEEMKQDAETGVGF